MLCFTLYLRAISKYKPPGGLYLEGDLTESFLRYGFGGLIFGAAYTWRGLFSEFYRSQLWLFSLPELQIGHCLFFSFFLITLFANDSVKTRLLAVRTEAEE